MSRKVEPPRVPTPPSNYRAEELHETSTAQKSEQIGALTIQKLIDNCRLVDKRFDSELEKLTSLKLAQIDRLAKIFPIDSACRVRSDAVWTRLFADRLFIGFSLKFTDRKIKTIEAVILFSNENPDLKYTVDTFQTEIDTILIVLSFKLDEFLRNDLSSPSSSAAVTVQTLNGFIECDRKQIEIESFQINSKDLLKPHSKLQTDKFVDGQQDFYALLAALPKCSNFMLSFYLTDSREELLNYLQAIKIGCETSNLFYLHAGEDSGDFSVIEIERKTRLILSLRTNNPGKLRLTIEQNEHFGRLFRPLIIQNSSTVKNFIQITDRIEKYLDSCPIVDDRVFLSHNRTAYRKFLHDIVNDQLQIDENSGA